MDQLLKVLQGGIKEEDRTKMEVYREFIECWQRMGCRMDDQ